jgi:hypothetical protein
MTQVAGSRCPFSDPLNTLFVLAAYGIEETIGRPATREVFADLDLAASAIEQPTHTSEYCISFDSLVKLLFEHAGGFGVH